jgi:hypothetical protein
MNDNKRQARFAGLRSVFVQSTASTADAKT